MQTTFNGSKFSNVITSINKTQYISIWKDVELLTMNVHEGFQPMNVQGSCQSLQRWHVTTILNLVHTCQVNKCSNRTRNGFPGNLQLDGIILYYNKQETKRISFVEELCSPLARARQCMVDRTTTSYDFYAMKHFINYHMYDWEIAQFRYTKILTWLRGLGE